MSTVINPENPIITFSKDNISEISECVFWIPCDETGAITTLTDAVSGGTVTIPSSTSSDGGVIIPNSPNSVFSGTLPALSGSFAMICLVETGDIIAAVSYGSGGQGVSISSAGSTIVGAGGTDTLDAAATTTLQKVLIYKDTTGDAYSYIGAPGAVLANTLNPVTASGVVTPTADELVIQAFSGDTTLYGLAMIDLSATSVPGDIVSWSDWTMEQWAVNNKVLPNRFTEL